MLITQSFNSPVMNRVNTQPAVASKDEPMASLPS